MTTIGGWVFHHFLDIKIWNILAEWQLLDLFIPLHLTMTLVLWMDSLERERWLTREVFLSLPPSSLAGSVELIHTLLLIIETFQCLLLAWLAKHSMAEAQGEPVNNLNARNETEAEEESQQTANLGNEIYWGHSQRSLELKHCRFLGKTLI